MTHHHPRRLFCSTQCVVALAAFCTSVVALAATTVEFKLAPQSTLLKGRDQVVATRLALAAGEAAPVAQGNGVFVVTTADDARASALSRTLREQPSVLWAQAKSVAARTSQAPLEVEFHSRILALTLTNGTHAPSWVNALAQRTGQALTLKRVTEGNRALVLLPAATTAASLAAVAVAAAAQPNLISAERVAVLRHQWIPNDTMFGQQWALGNGVGGIAVERAWDATPSGSVAVAVIDTGIRTHPELDFKRMSGYDMISDKVVANDDDGRDADASDAGDAAGAFDCSATTDFMTAWHGTHVAGIIAASSNNGAGVAGVAPNARIVPVRALGRCGGIDDDVADAVRWAAGAPVAGVPPNPNPAKVLNMSLGALGPCSAAMQSAIDVAIGRGAAVVVAAGNDATYVADFTPANCKGVIAVAAGNLLGDLSSYSNFGVGATLMAPGGDSGDLPGVISTLNGGASLPGVPSYATYSGSSMAAAHVSGVVALMLTRDPTLTAGQISNRLTSAARGFAPGSDCAAARGACGAGLLDAAQVMGALPLNRALSDLSGNNDNNERVRLVELRDATTGRYLLTADPVEMTQMLQGRRGGLWSRTGYAIDTFSFTAQSSQLALPQPVCRARLVTGGGYAFSVNTDECKVYAANGGWAVEGMVFQAALPNGSECPVGSRAVHEVARLDTFGYNVRTLADVAEINRMVDAGWIASRIAFCAPE
jgi:subtilisin family serine protease